MKRIKNFICAVLSFFIILGFLNSLSAAGLNGWFFNKIISLNNTVKENALAIGDGDNDGKKEIFFSYNSGIYSYKMYDSSAPVKYISPANSQFVKIAVGDGDSDSLNELYFSRDNILYEYQWDSSSWHQTQTVTLPYPVTSIRIADGDNDGKNDIFVGTGWYYYGYIFQIKLVKNIYGNWIYSPVLISNIGEVINMEIADGNNDGKNEIYSNSASYYGMGTYLDFISEFKWNGSTWVKTTIYGYYNNLSRNFGGIAVGDADNNGKNEVYFSSTPGYLLQASKINSSWSLKEIRKTFNDPLNNIIIGNADNNNKNELHGTYNYGKINVQFKFDSTWKENKLNSIDTTSVSTYSGHVFDKSIQYSPIYSIKKDNTSPGIVQIFKY
ncbi:hypothetical protein HY745_07625 [Candidatus Desantisbacteria bacterium]|nr:hypothetical protein [Candidatus Desantisbacteria bacterium]